MVNRIGYMVLFAHFGTVMVGRIGKGRIGYGALHILV
jgi:hypothetical protein